MSNEVLHGDRRVDRRYELELPIRFEYTGARDELHVGSGLTVDLSRGGVRIDTPVPPPLQANVQAWIAWPFLLQGVCPLELFVRAQVIGYSERGTVLRICSYEFRTCGERSFCEMPERSLSSMVA
ncbi:MAG: PilZ domain-containing protein [Bryobacteraceae bacterium]|jgi:hypothetical protein